MRIAYLGWGSLVWDPRGLPCKEWQVGGPTLPVDFRRISGQDRGEPYLSLIIAPTATTSTVRFAEAVATELPVARRDLMKREGTEDPDNVGAISATDAKGTDPVSEVIRAWTRTTGFDAAIWTTLGERWFKPPSRFGATFTEEQAVAFLNSLSGTARANALRYIARAPREVWSPFRERLTVAFNLDRALAC